jgi:hypothetical protein
MNFYDPCTSRRRHPGVIRHYLFYYTKNTFITCMFFFAEDNKIISGIENTFTEPDWKQTAFSTHVQIVLLILCIKILCKVIKQVMSSYEVNIKLSTLEMLFSFVLCACFVDRCLSVWPLCCSSIYGFWLPLWYFQLLLRLFISQHKDI